jgi:hypothetical protein
MIEEGYLLSPMLVSVLVDEHEPSLQVLSWLHQDRSHRKMNVHRWIVPTGDNDVREEDYRVGALQISLHNIEGMLFSGRESRVKVHTQK